MSSEAPWRHDANVGEASRVLSAWARAARSRGEAHVVLESIMSARALFVRSYEGILETLEKTTGETDAVTAPSP